ncbi:MAG: hypothetical protein ABSG59_18705 [Verrucomicrobiota bacterium]|jgi:uncharacterized small protein (DUF1192 family)
MNAKPSLLTPLTRRMITTCLLLAALLTAGALRGQNATRAAEKARGEQMLNQARTDRLEANRLYEASIKAAQTAEQDQEAANLKRLQARRLQHEAFLLIRDSNRMRAAELRAQAEQAELQAKTENVEAMRLRGLLAHQQQVAADAKDAAAKIRNAIVNASDPGEKADMLKMADALNEQGVQAGAEAARIEQRIAPIQAEINRLNASVSQLNQSAQRLAPADK